MAVKDKLVPLEALKELNRKHFAFGALTVDMDKDDPRVIQENAYIRAPGMSNEGMIIRGSYFMIYFQVKADCELYVTWTDDTKNVTMRVSDEKPEFGYGVEWTGTLYGSASEEHPVPDTPETSVQVRGGQWVALHQSTSTYTVHVTYARTEVLDGNFPLTKQMQAELAEMLEDEDEKLAAAESGIRADLIGTTGNLALVWTPAKGQYIGTTGKMNAITGTRPERTIIVLGKPNTRYVIRKDTATVMRAACGSSDSMAVGDQLSSYAGHTSASSDPLYVTTGETDVWIYVQLFIDSDDAALQSIDANVHSLTVREAEAAGGDQLSILLVGNSYTLDEFSYVPALLREAMPDVRFNFCMLYHGSGSLADHVTHMTEDTPYSYAYEYTDADRAWKSSANVKLSDVIGKYRYDIVVFNEASAVTAFANSKANIKTLIDGYAGMLDHPVSFMWQMSHVKYGANTYAQKAAMAQDALAESGICDVFVSGTAVENACTTGLDSLGAAGHMRYDSSEHLQEGIPCLVAAYANFLKLCELLDRKKTGVYGSQLRPTQEWTLAQSTPQRHGDSVGVSDANCLMAAKCAVAAIKNPFEITDCSEM